MTCITVLYDLPFLATMSCMCLIKIIWKWMKYVLLVNTVETESGIL